MDHTNYEAYLLDRMEGMLNAEQLLELEAFLLANPELIPNEEVIPKLHHSADVLSDQVKHLLKRSLPPEGMPGRTGIDDFLIARSEGDLTDVQLHALSLLLKTDPTLHEKERLYALTKVIPEQIIFTERQGLVRQLPPIGLPSPTNTDDLLVARLEGDLTKEQNDALTELIASDTAVARSWKLIQHTSVAALCIQYPHKAELKKGAKVIAITLQRWTVALAIAASIALLFGVGLWMINDGPEIDPQVATTIEKNVPITPSTPDTDKVVRGNAPVGSSSTGPSALAIDGTKDIVKSENDVVDPIRPTPMIASGPDHIDRNISLATLEARTPGMERVINMLAPTNVQTEAVWTPIAALAEPKSPSAAEEATGIGGFLVSQVRERVLELPEKRTGPLDMDDAVAAVDKGLQVVGGKNAGLDVTRKNGRTRGFDLRLGPNLSITAGR